MNNQFDDVIKEAESIINEDNATSKQRLLDEANQIINETMEKDLVGLEQLDEKFSKSTEIIKNRMGREFVIQLNKVSHEYGKLKTIAAYMDALGITKEDMDKYGPDVQDVFERVERAQLDKNIIINPDETTIYKPFEKPELGQAPEPEESMPEESTPEDYNELDNPEEENHKHR